MCSHPVGLSPQQGFPVILGYSIKVSSNTQMWGNTRILYRSGCGGCRHSRASVKYVQTVDQWRNTCFAQTVVHEWGSLQYKSSWHFPQSQTLQEMGMGLLFIVLCHESDNIAIKFFSDHRIHEHALYLHQYHCITQQQCIKFFSDIRVYIVNNLI